VQLIALKVGLNGTSVGARAWVIAAGLIESEVERDVDFVGSSAHKWPVAALVRHRHSIALFEPVSSRLAPSPARLCQVDRVPEIMLQTRTSDWEAIQPAVEIRGGTIYSPRL
jgi:hypothetical protein